MYQIGYVLLSGEPGRQAYGPNLAAVAGPGGIRRLFCSDTQTAKKVPQAQDNLKALQKPARWRILIPSAKFLR